MQDDITYNEETLGKLADGFHTYDYVGDLAGQKANDALHKWINDNTEIFSLRRRMVFRWMTAP